MAAEQESFYERFKQFASNDEKFLERMARLIDRLPVLDGPEEVRGSEPVSLSLPQKIQTKHPHLQIQDISSDFDEGRYDVNIAGQRYLFSSGEHTSLMSWESSFKFPLSDEERTYLLFHNLPRILYPNAQKFDPDTLKRFTTASVEWMEQSPTRRKQYNIKLDDILQEVKLSNILHTAPEIQQINFMVEPQYGPNLSYQFGLAEGGQAWIVLPKLHEWHPQAIAWAQMHHSISLPKPSVLTFATAAQTFNILNK